MIVCLEGGWVIVGWVFARALVEGSWFVLVLPYTTVEVLSCWSVVSAHLGELGHKGALYGSEPPSRMKVDDLFSLEEV